MSVGSPFIINLTRLGDLLQTQGTIHGLAAAGQRVGLLCLDAFAEAAGLLSQVEPCLQLPGAALLADLDTSWPRAVARVRDLAQEVRSVAPQRVINLTPTVPARLLARLLAEATGATPEGFILDAQGFGATTSRWADFLQAVSAHRGCSPFNLVDIMARMAGVYPPLDPRLAPVPEMALPLPPGDYVAVQLGASHPSRRYPVPQFAAAARVLFQELGLVPVLVGSPGERALAAEFAAVADVPSVNLVGETNLRQLAAVLCRCQLLLTNDTGTMHLAAGLGVPVVALFLATAQPWDTGPYQEGAICLEPDLPCHPCAFGTQCTAAERCQRQIAGMVLGQAVASWLTKGVWETPAGLGARVWQVTRDEAGFMDLVSLSGHGQLWRPRWLAAVRPLYRQFLDDLPLQPSTTALHDAPEQLSSSLQHAAGLLAVVEAQAVVLGQGRAGGLARKLVPHCQRVEDTLVGVSDLAPLGVLWRLSWHYQQELAGLAGLARRFQEMLRAMATTVGIKFE